MIYLLTLLTLMFIFLAFTGRLVKILVYARKADIKFAELADGLEIHPWRFLIMLLVSWGYMPSVQAWLRTKLRIPRSTPPKPGWSYLPFRVIFTGLTRLLFLSGFSGWVWKRSRLKALSKEEKKMRAYIRRYRLIPPQADVINQLQTQIIEIKLRKAKIRHQSKWAKDVADV